MPSEFNSEETQGFTEQLCRELGVAFVVVPIQDAYVRELAVAESMLRPGQTLSRITKQNIQARIRFTRMWNWSNSTKGFFPQNGNMSEKSVGYGTIGGGDMDGGVLSIIANLPKTVVEKFLRYLGRKYGLPSALAIADSVASAELEPNQEDERDLMPYPVLDACFAIFAGDRAMPLHVYRRVRDMFSDDDLRALRSDYTPGMLKVWVKRFTQDFMHSIFKWVRTPLALHLGSLDLERERAMQLPVVQSLEWLQESLMAIDAEP
jgi:NAD+ synthase (glutamine-hydrolysing)